MVRNKLLDLNNHLFEQMERLNDDDMTEEQLAFETKRAKAMSDVAQTIINNANTVIKAAATYGREQELPKMLGGGENEQTE